MEEEERLLLACPSWLGQIIKFALQTGLRLSELLTLEWNNIYMQDRYLTVLVSKNGKARGIPLGDVAMTILQDIQNASGQEILGGQVFRGPLGGKVTVNELQYVFRLAIRRTQLEDIHFHDLRHTCFTRMAQRNVDLYRIQVIAGHSSPSMTHRYAHHSIASLRSAV